MTKNYRTPLCKILFVSIRNETPRELNFGSKLHIVQSLYIASTSDGRFTIPYIRCDIYYCLTTANKDLYKTGKLLLNILFIALSLDYTIRKGCFPKTMDD